MHIRPTLPAETPALVELTAATGMFKPPEIEALQEVLDDFHAVNHTYGHRCITGTAEDGTPIGFAYHAPAAMTDRTWYLYWIAIAIGTQGHGLGSRLLEWVEADIRARAGRLLLIETSSLPNYEPTRQFYLRRGYEQHARLVDFYCDGDDMVVFRKRI